MGRLRIIGLVEGISYLVLLFVAMPLKYWADMPAAVRVVGSLHGGLFVLYVLALLHVMVVYRWSLWKGCLAFVLPLGTFWADAKLFREPVAA